MILQGEVMDVVENGRKEGCNSLLGVVFVWGGLACGREKSERCDRSLLSGCLVADSCILTDLCWQCSILFWDYGLSPGAKWLLQVSLHGQEKAAYVDLSHTLLRALFAIIWLLPVYLLSFALSCIWYS